jgi:hypothetical protein
MLKTVIALLCFVRICVLIFTSVTVQCSAELTVVFLHSIVVKVIHSFNIICDPAKINYGFSETRDESVLVIYFKTISQHLHAGIAEKILLGRQIHRLDGNSVRAREENNCIRYFHV